MESEASTPGVRTSWCLSDAVFRKRTGNDYSVPLINIVVCIEGIVDDTAVYCQVVCKGCRDVHLRRAVIDVFPHTRSNCPTIVARNVALDERFFDGGNAGLRDAPKKIAPPPMAVGPSTGLFHSLKSDWPN